MERGKKRLYPIIDAIEDRLGYKIDIEWFHELGLLTQIYKPRPAGYPRGRLIYSVLTNYLQKSKAGNVTIVETGTARGFAALCMSKALNDAGVYGKIITYDVLPNETEIYWNCIADVGRKHSRKTLLRDYEELLSNIIFVQGDTTLSMRKCSFDRVHFAFLDAMHTYEYVMSNFAF